MEKLISEFELPWHMWLIFGIILGGILFNSRIRYEVDKFLAHMFGLKKKDKEED